MGCDLYGLKPRIKKEAKKGWTEEGLKKNSKNGYHFRNINSYWVELIYYIGSYTYALSAEDYKNLVNNNEDYIISKKKSLMLAKELQKLIISGQTKKYQMTLKLIKGMGLFKTKSGYKMNHQIFRPFDVENVKLFAIFCKNSGGFRIG